MGKKNIQPNSSQPVFRSLVARPALEELREENLTEGEGQANEWGDPVRGSIVDPVQIHSDPTSVCYPVGYCSYDGDDE